MNQQVIGIGVVKSILASWDAIKKPLLKTELATFCQDNRWKLRVADFADLPVGAELKKLLNKYLS